MTCATAPARYCAGTLRCTADVCSGCARPAATCKPTGEEPGGPDMADLNGTTMIAYPGGNRMTQDPDSITQLHSPFGGSITREVRGEDVLYTFDSTEADVRWPSTREGV